MNRKSVPVIRLYGFWGCQSHTYFNKNYPWQSNSSLSIPGPSLSSVVSTSMSSISSSSGSPQKNFTAGFQRKRTSPDELLEFWSLPQEDFETIDPLQWWLGRRAQFPWLYCLARDNFSFLFQVCCYYSIFAVTNFFSGSAVAVERIFSVGRDTISLRRASLKPETIRILMLVRRRLILAREKK